MQAERPTVDKRRRRLNERLRAEYIAGAEEEWRMRTGRPMTAEELERVLRRYPGDAKVLGPQVGYGRVAQQATEGAPQRS